MGSRTVVAMSVLAAVVAVVAVLAVLVETLGPARDGAQREAPPALVDDASPPRARGLGAPPPGASSRLVPAPGPAGPQASGSVEATSRRAIAVRVEAGGRGVAGAVVTLTPSPEDRSVLWTGTTDTDGLASMPLPPGSRIVGLPRDDDALYFGLDVRRDGYRVASAYDLRDVEGGVVMVLEPGVAFDGRVVDDESGRPIAGASVLVTDLAREFECGPTDERGRFHVAGVANDEDAEIVAAAPGHERATLRVRVDSGAVGPAEPVLRLKRAGAIVGVVRLPDGTPAAEAVVVVRPASPSRGPDPAHVPESSADDARRRYAIMDRWHSPAYRPPDEQRATSDASGAFRVEGVPFDEDREAVAYRSGCAPSSPVGGLRVSAAASDRSVSLELRRAATVWVALRVAGAAVERSQASVRLFLLPEAEMRTPAEKDEPVGPWRFDDVRPGPFDAFVEASGYEVAVRRARVEEGETTRVEVELEPGADVDGIVVDPDGAPVVGAEVHVAAERDNRHGHPRFLVHDRTAVTDPQGRFRLRGVPRGDVLVVATRDDFAEDVYLGTRAPVRVVAPARDVRVPLARRGTLRMRLLTPDGAPFSGEVRAMLHFGDGGGGGGSETTEDGVLRSGPLDDGEHRWVVRPTGFAWLVRRATIRDGVPIDLGDQTLEPGVDVTGRVVDGAARALPDVEIGCFENDDRATRSDESGRFTLAQFPRHTFTLRFAHAGFAPTTLVVEPRRTTGLEVRLARLATVRGRVHATSAAALDDGRVEFRPAGAVRRREAVRGPDDVVWEIETWDGAVCPDLTAGGAFEVELGPGAWTVWWVDGDGVAVRLGEWRFGEGEVRALEFDVP